MLFDVNTTYKWHLDERRLQKLKVSCSILGEALKMEAQGFPETLAHNQNITRRNNPEDRNLFSHRRENLKHSSSYMSHSRTKQPVFGYTFAAKLRKFTLEGSVTGPHNCIICYTE
jgi:hypothetical protein